MAAPTEYIFTMHRVSRTHPPNKKVLEDISLSFYPGARIGVLGYNGAGKSSLLRIAFEELDLHRVIGRIDARNEASGRVLERLGMRREAHLIDNEWIKGEWTSEIAYGILADEWAQRSAGD